MATIEVPAPEALESPAAAPRPALKRSLGLWMATALVVGNMIGSGVFLLPASLAGIGPISLLSWGLTGAGAMLLALVFARLGRAMPRTGGPYAYTRHAFGDFVGFQTAWGYWIAVWAGNAAIATAFVGYLTVFWAAPGTNHVLAASIASGAIWFATLVNVLGAREGGAVQVVTTILKFIPLALVGLFGLFAMKSGNFSPFAPNHAAFSGRFDDVTTAGTLTLWAFIGLESATVPAEEVRDPERTLPRATLLGTGITTLVYIVATVALMGMIPAATLAGSTSPFADGARVIFGSSVAGVSPARAIALVAMISSFGCLNGWILLQGRVPLAAARDDLFPKRFAAVHGERGTPVFGLVVSSALATLLMFTYYNNGLVDLFNKVILLATLTTLVPYAFSAAAEIHMLFHDRERFSGVRLARSAVIASLAFAYSFWMIYGAGEETIAKGFLLLTAGIPVYLWMRWQKERGRGVGAFHAAPSGD